MQLKVLKPLAMALTILLSAGCDDRMELYRDLSERDANEVLAELSSKHIEVQKRQDKNGVAVLVATPDISRAVRVLEAVGLPHRSRSSLGEVFRKNGVISSPLEERARYLYALSQELEHTLSQIDGVVVARMHVVLPERVAPGEPVQPASAAVFIKHRTELDPDAVIPRIRRMVASSIPGISSADDKKLAVVFVAAQGYQETVEQVKIGPFSTTRERLQLWQWLAVACGMAVVFLLGGLLAINPMWRQRLFKIGGSRPVPSPPS
ncbi:type III secretion system inner membrane ring lipoprotein SctJ [Pseudomonas chlororaphis]|uniref:type III secretion system inner membrane ring lipoprotein SctJ n=1 Tax=Pseudomonas chlororaphis TaxID=587753 RepID=UPI000F57279A|nr:type III secretion inner membrane ring lipoprotein SctJ [Pseudomonas chlororaphis]AZC83990.1 Type III secretion bridge between inner and outermembrane lipoprotein (YscJ,HrcJ,EscJ, PscJ) [Pseudomonas chlororaphis subsp. piscium]